MALLSLARGLAAAGFLLENRAVCLFGLDTRAMSDPLFCFFLLKKKNSKHKAFPAQVLILDKGKGMVE